jgi:hypothetical protein
MMLTFFTGLLGFGGSFLPKVLDFFQAKSDQKHELAMLAAVQAGKVEQVRIEQEGALDVAEINEIIAGHQEQASMVKSSSRWIANLSSSIRPIITYVFVVEFLVINASIAYMVMSEDGVSVHNLMALLDNEFMGLLTMMLTFWFGSREIRRREGKV